VTAIRSWQEQFDVRTAASRLTRTVWQSVSLRLSVSGDVRYGEDFRLGRHSTVWSAHGLVIGRSVAVGRSCTVEVDGVIGDYTTVSAHVGIIGRRDHETGRVGTPIRRSSWTGDRPGTAEDRVVIGRDVFIGWGSVVLSGVAIGDAAVVGASSVVTRDVADGSVVAGNPRLDPSASDSTRGRAREPSRSTLRPSTARGGRPTTASRCPGGPGDDRRLPSGQTD